MFPICYQEHWVCTITELDRQNLKCFYFDSLQHTGLTEEWQNVAHSQTTAILSLILQIPEIGIENADYKKFFAKQKLNYTCGYFVLLFIERYFKNMPG